MYRINPPEKLVPSRRLEVTRGHRNR